MLATITPTSWPLVSPAIAAGPAAPPVAVDDGIAEDDAVEDPDVDVELRMVLDEDEDNTDVDEADEEVDVAEVTVEIEVAVDDTGVAEVVMEVVIEGVAVVEGGAIVVVV